MDVYFLPEAAVLIYWLDIAFVSILPPLLGDVRSDRRGEARVHFVGVASISRGEQTSFANAPHFVGSFTAADRNPCWTASIAQSIESRSAESGGLLGRVSSSDA